MTAAVVGISVALIAACVALSAFGLAVPVLWKAYAGRSDQYVEKAILSGQQAVQLTEARAERDAAKKSLAERDEQITTLIAQNKELSSHAVHDSTNAGLLDLANGVHQDRGGREANPGPGTSSPATVRTVRP